MKKHGRRHMMIKRRSWHTLKMLPGCMKETLGGLPCAPHHCVICNNMITFTFPQVTPTFSTSESDMQHLGNNVELYEILLLYVG